MAGSKMKMFLVSKFFCTSLAAHTAMVKSSSRLKRKAEKVTLMHEFDLFYGIIWFRTKSCNKKVPLTSHYCKDIRSKNGNFVQSGVKSLPHFEPFLEILILWPQILTIMIFKGHFPIATFPPESDYAIRKVKFKH